MGSFPAITRFESGITTLINNTPKSSFSGNKVWMSLTKFMGPGDNKIYYGGYTTFDLSKMNSTERFPPILTGLEIGTSGNLGAIKKAKVNIRFASMKQFEANSGFFKVGSTQLVQWGWGKTGGGGKGGDFAIAKNIVNNLKNYQALVSGQHEYDALAGVVVNFSIKMNADATVDTVVELGAPADIPGYLQLNKKENKTSSIDSDDHDNDLANIAKALDLDGALAGTTKDEIKSYSINFWEWSWDQVWQSFSTWGESDQAYIQLGFAIEKLCNFGYKKKNDETTLDMIVDLSQAICKTHPYMISVSENVVFPNPNTPWMDRSANDEQNVKITKPLTSAVQQFGPFNAARDGVGDVFPHQSAVTIQVPQEGAMVNKTYTAQYTGYIKNMYVSTKFLIDTARGTETIHDFLQKIVDELNVAGAGVYNLMVKGDFTDKQGKEVLSIIDLHLYGSETLSDAIQLFGANSRIIDLNLTADLPKAMVGELLLGGSNSTKELGSPGSRMFTYDLSADPLAKAVYGGGGAGYTSSGTPPTTTEPPWYTLWGRSVSNFFKSAFNLGGPNLVKFKNGPWFGDGGVNSMFGVYKDVSVIKTLYNNWPNKNDGDTDINRNALVPVTVSMTMLGISGITIGTAVKIKPSPAPWIDNKDTGGGYWQVTNVEHKVDDTKWETIIECKYRLGK